MDVVHDVEIAALIIGATGIGAIAASRLARLLRVPAPAVFLICGLALAELSSRAHDIATFERVAQLGSYALIFILFEGGFSNGGWLRTGPSVGPILTLGVVGTLLTTGMLAAACHWVIGLPVELSVLIGVALAPTDPAAVFSVLGEQDVEGTTDIILEGESGANDPVGISLMLGAIAYYESGGSLGGVTLDFALQLLVGIAVGVAAGLSIAWALGRVRIGSDTLHVVAALSGAFLTFAIAGELHGSGFLAVFVSGLLIGRVKITAHEASEGFLGVLAALSEMVMFAALGLTVTLGALGDALPRGLAIFAILTFIARPLVTLLITGPMQLTNGERAFVAWGGLKGAVPILLASLPIIEHVDGAHTVYEIVFVAVVASVLLQGSTLPLLARRVGLLRAP
jgi:cell volume regulation protein A